MSSQVRLPFQFSKRHGVIAASDDSDQITVFHSAPLSAVVLSELQRHLQQQFQLKVISDAEFQQVLERTYEHTSGAALDAVSQITMSEDLESVVAGLADQPDLLEGEDDAPIIKMINSVMREAIQREASDVHFEVFEKKLVVRFRIDGVLQEVLEPPRAIATLLMSRIKVMAKLDIAEKRLPQDGRVTLKLAGRSVDMRVSTMPTHFGERIVLRILDKQKVALSLSSLGMTEEALSELKQLIAQAHGIVLVTGPTGSGKTTTLYAALLQLDHAQKNILTVEDPIEYDLPSIGQTAVNAKIGMTFSRGLRAMLRQDPDVVMVGEIRDLETVKMAMQASLTGHLVFSTLHTNSAVGAIARLRDMGAESFLLSSTLIGVVAQRLVRLLCDQCKQSRQTEASEEALMGLTSSATICDAVGCDACGQTGFRGRTGIYELVTVTPDLKTLIHDQASEQVLAQEAHQRAPTLRQDGWVRVLSGKTTITEVLRVTDEGVVA